MEAQKAAAVFVLVTGIFCSTSHAAVVQQPCVKITAGLTVSNMNYYIFAGNEYTHYDMMGIRSGSQAPSKGSVSEFTGLEPGTSIDAGVVDPVTNKIRLFSGSDVYLVDPASKKVDEKSSISALFSEEDRATLGEKGVQAAAASGDHVYIFSGCHVIKTNILGGSSENLSMPDGVPCDVDAALPFPQKSGSNLLIVKDSKAYGLHIQAGTGYDMMRCVSDVLMGIPFNLCQC